MIGHVHRGEFGEVGVDEIRLGEHDDAGRDAEQLEDPQMLLRLGLPSLGGGHDEHASGHAPDTGQHVAEELHVTGHVDEAQLGTRRQRRVREPEVDREPAPLLLLEPVGVGSGQRENQG